MREAFTTPACEHADNTDTPRPRTWAASNRSSRIEGSGSPRSSRERMVPDQTCLVFGNSLIWPLPTKSPATGWGSLFRTILPPAAVIWSNVGSGGQ